MLDLSTVGPAARCTRLLADYGAVVVKVGPVPTADAAPIVPQYFAYSGHRGMRRVLVDLKDEDGRSAFLALAASADVVVESFRPGVVTGLGSGYAAVSERNPGVLSTARRAATARTAPRRNGPGTTSTTWRWAGIWP